MHYVYLLESESAAGRRYVRLTSDLKRRLTQHNAGKSSHSSKFAPWRLAPTLRFPMRPKHLPLNVILKLGPDMLLRRSDCGSVAIQE